MSKPITQTFPLTGMLCSSCANILTKAILKVPGVISAQVTYTTDKATIDYDLNNINWLALKKAVSSLGSYQIILPNESTQPQMLLKTKVIISAVLSLIIMFSEIFKLLPREIIFILTTVVLFYSGREFFINAFLALKKMNANMDTLIALGTGAAYLYSASIIFSSQPAYFDTAATIITLILLGRYLEVKAKTKASQAIKKLLNLQVKKALLFNNGQEVEVDIDQVKTGDQLLVKPGVKVPVDAIILKGQSYLDESLVTGESVPVLKKEGDKVIGSTINKKGLLIIQATKVGEDTLLANIVKLVNQAQSSRAPIQKLADKVSGIFVPVVVLLSILAFLIWHFIFGLAFSPALVISITILIVSCPCALGLATPISILVATGLGAGNGILIKNAEKLQIAGNIKAIVFDKTGTLTQGSFAVTEIIPADISPRWKALDILKLAASLEQGSDHPIAEAIVEEAKDQKLKLFRPTNFSNIEGQGIAGTVDHQSILLGNWLFMKQKNLKSFGPSDKTTAYLSVNNQIIGAIALEDKPKEAAKSMIEKLHQQGLAVWMISGDNQATAENIGQRLGIKNILSEVLPQDKVTQIRQLQQQYSLVAMAGDGINDAPALAQANVGIAMATGTDVAIEAGDITLLRGDLNLICQTIALSRATMRNIKQNLFWAFGYNLILIPVAMAGRINPMLAAGAMAFSSLSVVLNALRLRRLKL
ncbi:MAG: heavy metal translocating P-type ATPase [Candidatus Beckwithbacteria bacterium]